MLHRVQHYDIIEELGKGGMGVVYKAEDTRLKRPVALKILVPGLTADQKARARFTREAQLASSLQHENICTIHEINETEEGEVYICMDYYPGKSLQTLIEEEIPSLETILEYAEQIAEGLSFAHKKNIIHRDIKPANVMVLPDGTVKILDFGLARNLGDHTISKSGHAMGTLSYSSPEQARGEGVDHCTDIWSLGVILYEMTTGLLPFTHEFDAAVIYSILDKSPLPPTEIQEHLPEELERIIYRCLKKNKQDRYASAKKLQQDLKGIREQLEGKAVKDTPSRQSPKKQAERRPGTVIVSEISAFQEIQKRYDEERMNAINGKCARTVGELCEKYGGYLLSNTGNSFTIAFGIPDSMEKTPEKAVRCCMELQNKFRELEKQEKLETPLILRSGINTGVLIVNPLSGTQGERYTISGTTLNYAEQLMDLSTEGQILTGFLTYRNTRHLHAYKTLKPSIPVGNKKSSPVFLLLSGSGHEIPHKTAYGKQLQARMVGREKEMDLLLYYLMKLLQGEGFIVNVVGEPGLGKSRLMAEFLNTEAIHKISVLEGRAFSSGENQGFNPLIEIIQKLAGIQEKDKASQSFQKLENLIRSCAPDNPAEVFPFVATLMGIPLSGKYAERLKGIEGEGLEKLIFKNLHTLFIGASRQKPLIIILEDLHWADISTLNAMRSLYRLSEKHPILFINVLRPDYPDTGEMIRSTIRDRYEKYHVEIILEALGSEDSNMLIRELLHTRTIPSGLVRMISQKVEGNPFFIEEVLRSLIDMGAISMEQDSVRFTQSIESQVIPETINEVLMTRIDRLDVETRMLLKHASVIGRSFFISVLGKVTENTSSIQEKLNHLIDLQLLRKRERLGGREYLFKHALIQQAAYDSLLHEQRKEIHLKVAKAIEDVFSERLEHFYSTLAYHLSQAEDRVNAESYLLKAGERALTTSASHEALNFFKEALDHYLDNHGVAADQEKVAALNRLIGIAYYNCGHYIEASEYLEKVLVYNGMSIPKNKFLLAGKLVRGILVFLFRIYFPSSMGRQSPTEEDEEIHHLIFMKTSGLSLTDNQRFFQDIFCYAPWFTKYKFKAPYALQMTSGVFTIGGISLNISKRIGDYLIENCDPDDIKSVMAAAYAGFDYNLLAGKWNSENFNQSLVDHSLQVGEAFFMVTYVAFKAHEYIEMGNREVEQLLQIVDDFSETGESDYGRLVVFTHKSLYLYKYKEYEKALSLLNQGIQFFIVTMGNRPGLLMCYAFKIHTLIMMNDLKGAEETFLLAENYTKQERFGAYFLSFFLTASLHFETARMEEALQSGDPELLKITRQKAFKLSRKARRMCRMVAYERVETFRLTGILYWLSGKQSRACSWWSRAIREAEALGAKLELANTLNEVAIRLSESGSKFKELKGTSKQALLDRSRVLFREMEIETP